MKWNAAMVVALICGLAASTRQSLGADSDAKPFPPGIEQAAGEFWSRWEGVKPSDAIRRAATTPDDERSWEEIGQRSDDFQARCGGRCLGHVELSHKSLGDNMEYVSYFALYDPTPMRVHLLFYRARDVWRVISIRVDSEPSRWLEEAAESQFPTPPQVGNP